MLHAEIQEEKNGFHCNQIYSLWKIKLFNTVFALSITFCPSLQYAFYWGVFLRFIGFPKLYRKTYQHFLWVPVITLRKFFTILHAKRKSSILQLVLLTHRFKKTTVILYDKDDTNHPREVRETKKHLLIRSNRSYAIFLF